MKPRFYRSPEAGEGGQEIDLDLLSVADTGGPSSIDINSLPDITKEMSKALGGNPAPPNPPAPPAAGNEPPNPLEWLKPYEGINQKIKEKFTDFELPADVKPETYADALLQFVEAKTQKQELNPVLEQINAQIARGIPVEEAINKYQETNNFLSMSPEQRMFVHMKNELGKTEDNPNGLDDEAIRDRVKRLNDVGMLELQDKQIRDSYQSRMTEKQQAAERIAYEQYMAQFQAEEKQRMDIADLSLQNFKKLDNIAGIPLTQSDKQEFDDTFKFITKRNPNDGLSILDALLQSNDFLMKSVYLGLKAEPKFRAAITEAKEGVKKTFIDKLDKQPDLGRGQNLSGIPNSIDYDALATPEQN